MVRYTSIRIVFSLVVHFDMELRQMNIKIIFLHGELEEILYMVQP